MLARCGRTIKPKKGRSFHGTSSKMERIKTPMKHIIFGANTDVGKTVVTAGLVRSTGTNGSHYIKPLQCGGSDENFVRRHAGESIVSATTLFNWNTPTSPHTASYLESFPVSDKEVLESLQHQLRDLESDAQQVPIWVETAGGVLSPSSASPANSTKDHARNEDGWGWIPQGDLYKSFQRDARVVLIGDGRLGGISSTLSSLESLLSRGYNVAGIVFIETEFANRSALQEYASRACPAPFNSSASLFDNPIKSIISLPALPPEPEPLMKWYESSEVTETLGSFVTDYLPTAWNTGLS